MKAKNFIIDNLVVIIFVSFTVLGFIVSGGVPIIFFLNELIDRVFRNSFLVLSLIIPIIAGLGLNFGIVVGAMVGQAAIIFVRYHALVPTIAGYDPAPFFGGLSGLMLCFILAFPVAALCGYITGRLYNRVRGQEMIASLIVGFFAQGIYLFIFLFVVGIIIPVVPNHPIIKFDNIGLRMSVDLGFLEEGGMKFALDNIWRVPPMYLLLLGTLIALVILTVNKIRSKSKIAPVKVSPWRFGINITLCVFGLIVSIAAIVMRVILTNCGCGWICDANPAHNTGFVIFLSDLTRLRGVPVVTGLVMASLCLFLHFLPKTKLGQDFRSVGQSQHIAEVSGINVDKTRIIATMFSTVLAAWGMIIFMQNMGTMATFDSFRNIGFFSVAAILVGGASTSRASLKNAIMGALLFNAMTIISPEVGLTLFTDANAGEFFRSFLVYGCIALALGLYVWKQHKAARDQNTL